MSDIVECQHQSYDGSPNSVVVVYTTLYHRCPCGACFLPVWCPPCPIVCQSWRLNNTATRLPTYLLPKPRTVLEVDVGGSRVRIVSTVSRRGDALG